MKKILFALLIIGAATVSNAQSKSSDASAFHFGGGLRLGLPLGDFGDGYSFGIGAELQGEYMFSPTVSGTFTTGYTSFIGKEETIYGYTFKNPSLGYIPILAGVRVYPSTNFFVGAKVGYGVLTGSGSSTGAFNYEPQVGYNAEKFQLALGYNGLSKSGATSSHLGLSAIYKFN